MKTIPLAIVLFGSITLAQDKGSPADHLPAHITRLTMFGERADFSHDGKRILFLEKTFGQVFEIEIATKTLHPVTHHYQNGGYTRAMYLANGDILLSGPKVFDSDHIGAGRSENAEL